METLYRKVAVSEILPETKKYYITDKGELYLDAYKNWQLSEFSKKAKVSKYHEEYFEEPDFWIEEIPNPTTQLQADKAELLEALEKISKVTNEGYMTDHTDFQVWESELKQVHSEIESLIQKMKKCQENTPR